jgi:hypothetical protein
MCRRSASTWGREQRLGRACAACPWLGDQLDGVDPDPVPFDGARKDALQQAEAASDRRGARPVLLEFEDQLRENQRGDLAQLHRAEPPVDVLVPQVPVCFAGARRQLRLGIQAPVVAHELGKRLSASVECGKIAFPFEQPQPCAEVLCVLGAVEGPSLAFALRVLEADPVGVAELVVAVSAAVLADLNATYRSRNAHVSKR